MNRFPHSSLRLSFSLSFFCMLFPLCPLLDPLPSIHASFLPSFSSHFCLSRVSSSTVLSPLHSFITPSLVLIYSPSTHTHTHAHTHSLVRAAWNYLLLNGLQQLTPAQRCFALFIDFHSFCLCVFACVCRRSTYYKI